MTSGSSEISLRAIGGLPIVEAGDDLGALVMAGLAAAGEALAAGDVVVLAQKVVSKAEGRFVDLGTVTPSARARAYAADCGKDPRLVELILAESRAVLRCRPGVLVVEHRLGHVTANAGIDQSNVQAAPGEERVLLLPRDPDASARRLQAALERRYGAGLAVVINDSVGRAWRLGTAGLALGVAGLPALLDRIGRPDLFGRKLEITQIGFADEIAAAASLLMGQADEGRPLVRLRGLAWDQPASDSAALRRPLAEDLFR